MYFVGWIHQFANWKPLSEEFFKRRVVFELP